MENAIVKKSYFVPREIHIEVKKAAAEREVKVSDIVVDACRRYLEEMPRRAMV